MLAKPSLACGFCTLLDQWISHYAGSDPTKRFQSIDMIPQGPPSAKKGVPLIRFMREIASVRVATAKLAELPSRFTENYQQVGS